MSENFRDTMEDFSALIPFTTQERFLWAAVTISEGICEELVFRGWLLSTLHGMFNLQGTAVSVIAATVFGLAHAYQGITGMVLTAFAGALFCGLHVATGSLLAPILLHVLIDLRFAVLPAPRPQGPRAHTHEGLASHTDAGEFRADDEEMRVGKPSPCQPNFLERPDGKAARYVSLVDS